LPRAHAEHAVAPELLKKPTPQGVGAPAPKGQKEPAGHVKPIVTPCAQYEPAAHGFAVAVALPAAAQKPAAHARAPDSTVPAATVCGGDTEKDAPEPPVMVVPFATPAPVSVMPTRSTPDVTPDTVSVAPEMAPATTGAVAPVIAALATVCDALTVHVQGKALSNEQEPAVTVVPAATPAPRSVMPTDSGVLDDTAVTVSRVPAMEPVKAALGNAGAAPRPAGQK
jgi:hypothetical protein